MTQAWALLASLVLEAVLAVGMARWLGSPRRWWWAVAAAVVGTTVTHPFLWWAADAWAPPPGPGWLGRMLVLEGAVAGVEAWFYVWLCRLPAGRALTASIATNAFSFAVGLAISAVQWAVGEPIGH